ncbi:hypothetical protein AMJ52_01975 [candidate division TA06 bacterium DG_78]|uniref:Putative zinc-finger domain-containing protein n=1 Tax=candidate division TA06 bacterium DG_78 TaxID=1703772 RepID=A0A0S7YH51_UNCT6|nr:MAG: hypothetical protein AMJ52_01975 [candidate division TA06 bacterium DG_78]
MKCDLSIELLSGYLDGELDDEQRVFVEKHLKQCRRCRNAFKEFALLDEQIRKQKFEEPSREFIFGVNRRIIDKVKKKKPFFIFRYTPVFAPAAVAILLFVVLINISKHERMIGIDDRVVYAEITPRQKLELQIPESKIVDVKEAEKKIVAKTETRAGTSEITPASEEVAKIATYEGADELYTLDDGGELQVPKDQITRAIIDSTGRVLKVATGNSIIPERDTVMENRLQGQRLTAPTIAGKKTQMYVDLTPVQKANH